MSSHADDPMQGQDLAAALRNLAASQSDMQKVLQSLLDARAVAPPQQAVRTPKNPIARPEPFKGASTDARRFLQFFTAWARGEGPPLNSDTGANEKQWITAALSFMQGEASIWAAQYLQEIEAHTVDPTNALKPFPFGAQWSEFLAAYRLRFQAVDDTEEAQRELATIVQGKKTVAEYAARFQQVSGRTGYGDTDLMSRFKAGLSKDSRLWLTMASLHSKPQNFTDLVKRAMECDAEMRNLHRNPRATQPAVDPYAMEIDATHTAGSRGSRGGQNQPAPQGNGRTREEFLRLMRGRCFGCGDSGHIKADGNHGRTKCNYCSRLGHQQNVCQDRFLGFPKNRGANRAQRAAATNSLPFTLFADDAPAATLTDTGSSNAQTTPGATDLSAVYGLAEAVKKQTEAISAALSADKGF